MTDSGSSDNWKQLSEQGLNAARDVFENRTRELCKEFLSYTCDKFIEYSEKPSLGNKGFEYLHARSRLQQNHHEVLRIFTRELRSEFDGLYVGEGKDEPFKDDSPELMLVEQDELEENTALIAIRQRAESDCSEALWMLCQRFSLITGGRKLEENDLPCAPASLCTAVKRALVVGDMQLSAKLLAFKLFEQKVILRLPTIYADMNKALADLGVLPNLQHKTSKSKQNDGQEQHEPIEGDAANDVKFGRRSTDTSTGRRASDQLMSAMAMPAASLPVDQYQRQLAQNILVLQSHLASSQLASAQAGIMGAATAGSMATGPSSSVQTVPAHQVLYSSPQLLQATSSLQNLESALVAEQLATGTVSPLDLGQIKQQLVAQLQEVTGEESPLGLGEVDMNTIDVVGLLFEYMLNDEQIPDSVKASLSFLHTPFLKLAFQEDLFNEVDHPARLFLNTLADAGAKWVSNDGSSQFNILDQIRKTVRQVLDEQSVDSKLFSRLLQEFNLFIQKIELRVQLLEKRATEKAQGEDRLREVKKRVNREVYKRINGKEIPTAITLFIVQPWSDYMAFVLLRHGNESDAWKDALTVLDGLLWGLNMPNTVEARDQWEQKYQWIQSMTEKGFDLIGYDAAKAAKLKRSVDRVYKLKEQNQPVEEVAPEVREKLARIVEQKAGDEKLLQELSENEIAVLEKLKLMEFGTWFEYKDGRREKVAWYNSHTSQYLFVDQAGKRSGIKTGPELVKAMVAGEIKMITGSTKPLVERTMELIYSDLNQKLQAQFEEGESKDVETT